MTARITCSTPEPTTIAPWAWLLARRRFRRISMCQRRWKRVRASWKLWRTEYRPCPLVLRFSKTSLGTGLIVQGERSSSRTGGNVGLPASGLWSRDFSGKEGHGPQLEMSLQVGELLHHKQSLVWRRCSNFLVLQYPGLVVGYENGVHACG